MRYKNIRNVESLIDLAICAFTVVMIIFPSYWLGIIAYLLLISDWVAMTFAICVYQKERKHLGTTLKKHWFNLLWLVLLTYIICKMAFMPRLGL